jgi:hypothetical protein
MTTSNNARRRSSGRPAGWRAPRTAQNPRIREKLALKEPPAGPASWAEGAAAAGGRLRCRAASAYFSVNTLSATLLAPKQAHNNS